VTLHDEWTNKTGAGRQERASLPDNGVAQLSRAFAKWYARRGRRGVAIALRKQQRMDHPRRP